MRTTKCGSFDGDLDINEPPKTIKIKKKGYIIITRNVKEKKVYTPPPPP